MRRATPSRTAAAPRIDAAHGRLRCGRPENSPTPAAQSPFAPAPSASATKLSVAEFDVPTGTCPHDVAPAADGGVWFTAQGSGQLGHLDPVSGKVELTDLGDGSAPHGVIVGSDGAAWITDGGLNAIVKVDPATQEVKRFDLPGGSAKLNTAAFDGDGVLWFTGQGGVYGKVDPSGEVKTFPAPKGRGPYGITSTPDGVVWFSSLAGSYIARIDSANGELKPYNVPSAGGAPAGCGATRPASCG